MLQEVVETQVDEGDRTLSEWKRVKEKMIAFEFFRELM
jgi:hypothetical protein